MEARSAVRKKIRPPLVFSSHDAKLFLASPDEVLTAL
jgi:hypothetical protein